MIYELLNEGYFDAAKKSSISVEDTKERVRKLRQKAALEKFKEEYASPKNALDTSYTLLTYNNSDSYWKYTVSHPEDRFSQLISCIIDDCYYKRYDISEYTFPKIESQPIFTIKGKDLSDIERLQLRMVNICDLTAQYDIERSYIETMFTDTFVHVNIPCIVLNNYEYYSHIIYDYLVYFKHLCDDKGIDVNNIDLKDKKFLDNLYTEFNNYQHSIVDKYGKNVILTHLHDIIDAGIVLNMSYNEILSDIPIDYNYSNLNKGLKYYIGKNNKIYYHILFKSEKGQKTLSALKHDLKIIKDLLEKEIGICVVLTLNFVTGGMHNNWLSDLDNILKKITV